MNFKEIISQLPQNAGIYKFFDKENTIIYVGKAKNLKNRVSSYFTNSQQHTRKTLRLVSQIVHLEFTIVNTELDALLLENSLIKEHQPKYNILLKDGKTYPYICITNESFPKVVITRNFERKEGTYYGPYSNIRAMNSLLELIKQLYTIRTCSYNLSKENIDANKYKVCLEYHIKNCKGGCEGLQTEQDYLKDIELVHQILRGKVGEVKDFFEQRMYEYATELAFEKAQEYKQKLGFLSVFQEKSLVVNPKITDVMVLSVLSNETKAFLNFLDIQNGSIIHTETFEVEKKLDEPDEEILVFSMFALKEKYKSRATEILTNIQTDIQADGFNITIPQIGDKRKLLEMSLKNTFFAQKEHLKQKETQAEKYLHTLKKLQEDLRLQELPTQIECFDNSNIQGTNPVASMVYFKSGKPSKSNYRHFHIKTVQGPNDFASMYEIVTRRYKRLIEEKKSLPQLVIVDGGKGQLSSACQALKDLGIYGQFAIIGIAKRLEEIYFPEDSIPLYLSKKSESLRLIQRIRDEAHRFAITFHRDVRSKNSIQSQLIEIEGIGEKTMQKLYTTFKTINQMKEAGIEAIEQTIGKAKAKIFWERIHRNSEEKV